VDDLNAKKDALIETAKRCFDLRLQTNAGGNLSVRLDSADAIVIKPSGVGFNECTRDNLQVVHLDGTLEPSDHKPSKDLEFHLDLYRILPQPMGHRLCKCGHRNSLPDGSNHRKNWPYAADPPVAPRWAANGQRNQPGFHGRKSEGRGFGQPRHHWRGQNADGCAIPC